MKIIFVNLNFWGKKIIFLKCQFLETSIFVNLKFWNLFESLVWEQTSIEKIVLRKGPNLAIFDMNISMRLLANFKHCAKPQKGVKSSAELMSSFLKLLKWNDGKKTRYVLNMVHGPNHDKWSYGSTKKKIFIIKFFQSKNSWQKIVLKVLTTHFLKFCDIF